MDFYDHISDIYDLWTDSDVAGGPSRHFYIEQARSLGGKVLEVGAGSGRITLALADQGIETIAIDSSAAMIDQCAKRLSRLNKQSHKKVELKCVDIFDFQVEATLDLVILPMRTLGHFLTHELRLRLFEKVYSLLRPQGLFIFDHFVAREAATRARDGLWEFVAYKSIEDTVMLLSHCYKADFGQNILRSLLMVETLSSSGLVLHKKLLPYDLAWIEPQEVKALQQRCGFKLRHLYGNFACGEFTDGSDEQIWILEKEAP
jgi:SAM-dependent methyltransferase